MVDRVVSPHTHQGQVGRGTGDCGFSFTPLDGLESGSPGIRKMSSACFLVE